MNNLTKRALVERLIGPSREFGGPVECCVVAHRLMGDDLWTVVEASTHYGPYEFDGEVFEPGVLYRFIRLHELKNLGLGAGWDIDFSTREKEHPPVYSCPLRYLKIAPQTCLEWRRQVHQWHRTNAGVAPLKVGDVIVSSKPRGMSEKTDWDMPRYRLIEQIKPSKKRGAYWVMEDIDGGQILEINKNTLRHFELTT